jgi:hypothetical protein
MKCNICKNDTEMIFSSEILNKYKINYFNCKSCKFVQTERPFWLSESYNESINSSDTSIMSRNIYTSKITTLVIFLFFNKNKKFLDFAGGYGIFTRLMRDIGFDFYWNDKFTKNLVSKVFEHNKNNEIELITSFESFEHFDNPIEEIENMLKISKNILFSTNLINDVIPKPEEWSYYALDNGQHISFYNKTTLEYIAKKYNLNLYTDGKIIHLLTEKKISPYLFKFSLKIYRYGIILIIKRFLQSKTKSDAINIIKKLGTSRVD